MHTRTHTHMCTSTLCWTSPYSRPGSSQNVKFWCRHSMLNDEVFADPNSSSRNTFINKHNAQCTLYIHQWTYYHHYGKCTRRCFRPLWLFGHFSLMHAYMVILIKPYNCSKLYMCTATWVYIHFTCTLLCITCFMTRYGPALPLFFTISFSIVDC